MSERTEPRQTTSYRAAVLGPFNLERDGAPIGHLQRRVEVLLKLLLTAPDRQRTRDDLIDLLWPDADRDSGGRNLRLLTHRLRTALGGEEPAVVSEGGWIALSPTARWELDLEVAEAVAVDDDAADDALLEAAALFRGEPFVEDRYDDWATLPRERAARAWRLICLRLARRFAGRQAIDGALSWYERILEADPLDEAVVREYMAALDTAGRPAGALRLYASLESRLAAELEIAPAPQTADLVERIRAATAALPAVTRFGSPAAPRPLTLRPPVRAIITGPPLRAAAPAGRQPRGTRRAVALLAALLVAILGIGVLLHSSRGTTTAIGLHGPTAITVGPDGTIYVVDSGNNRVVTLDSSGRMKVAWGKAGSSASYFSSPKDLAITPSGDLAVSDTGNKRIEILRAGRQFDEVQVDAGALAINNRGQMYATDYGRQRIWHISPNGDPLDTIALPFVDVGRYPFAAGMTADRAGNLYIADRLHDRVLKLSPSGTILASYGRTGSGYGELNRPTDVDLDARGNLYVADARNHRVEVFSPSGRPIATLGSEGHHLGQFDQPSSVALDARGNVYVADYYQDRVECFSRIGKPLWASDGVHVTR